MESPISLVLFLFKILGGAVMEKTRGADRFYHITATRPKFAGHDSSASHLIPPSKAIIVSQKMMIKRNCMF